jgi:hypothetical protein
MKFFMGRVRQGLLAAGTAAMMVAAAYACVPADTRPPPGVLTMTVSPSDTVEAGVTTVDGWTIHFDRVFVVMGNESLSDQCTVYGEADYDRVLDVSAGPGQKLGILHGLGRCDVRFRAGPPSTDVVLGASVTPAERTALQIPEPDPYSPTEGRGAGGSGTAFEIAGTATKDGVTKKFDLIYRRPVRYQRCTTDSPPPDASFSTLNDTVAFSDAGDSVNLGQQESVVYDLRIEPEAVFRDDPNPSSAALRFAPFAASDVDQNGEITLDELRAVPITTLRDSGAFEAGTYDFDDDAGVLQRGKPIVIESLGDYVYQLLFPTLPRFRGTGWCVTTGMRRPD